MNQLYCTIPVWNAGDKISECLDSVISIADKILIAEGKWTGYRGDVRSSDETIDIIVDYKNRFPDKICIYFLPSPMHQSMARNVMISSVPDGDYFLSLDSDEKIFFCPKNFKNEFGKYKGFFVQFYEPPQLSINALFMGLPRIIKKENGLHMSDNHRYYDYGDGTPLIYNQVDFKNLPIIIEHNPQKRIRPEAEEYKVWLNKWEKYY